MRGQLPEPGAVFLDHVAFFVPDMDAAGQALEACGFRLTPFTVQNNRVAGREVPAGTGNRCAMLGRGYLELLTATSETPLAAQLRERVSRHVGLHLAAFSTADAAAEHRRLDAAGFPVLPLVDMHRAVGNDEARFSIARIEPGPMPEGRIQFLTHHTESLVWRPGDLEHPNGAHALTGLWIAAEDPDAAALRFACFTGRRAERRGEVVGIALERGILRIATPDYLRQAIGIVPPASPCLAAAMIAVTDPAAVSESLAAAGLLPVRVRLEDGEAVAVSLPAAAGGALLFHAAT